MSAEIISTCPLCGCNHQIPFRAVDDYRIVRCVRCDGLFVSPPPTASELTAVYQQESYFTGGWLGYNDYFAQRPMHEQIAQTRLRRIERWYPQCGRILDVGCAAGFFLHVAQERGWEPLGVDISHSMAAHAAQLIDRPIAATIEDLELPPASLDAVTMWEYIEHVPNPAEQVRRLVELLKPGGVLALSTPNTGYWTAVHQPDRWREFKPPAHLIFFTEPTLRCMLESCGLEVLAVPHTQPRAPAHPYAFQRLLELLRRRVGNGAERRTPLWWTFSLAWRLAEQVARLRYRFDPPGSDVNVCLEAYARKR
jgi:2-polyprenyl-3-methyl-5-hydroxy-6-metoxy-1,4-benzoquinol methylase